LTKLVNAIVFLNSDEKKAYISNRALRATGYYGLIEGESFEKKKAIEFMLIESVNDIASAISFGPGPNYYSH
jgi:D-alanyl-D-alanine carboxypeptidase